MINNINKNISVWRGDKTPPTEYHVWIKSNGSVLINKDGTWHTLISESTNDSVNVCNLSDSHHLTLEEALDIVALYLGKEVFHAGYKIRFNVNTKFENPNVWKEYIFTAAAAGDILYKLTLFWKLLATSDLFDSNGEIRSLYLPSYVDDVLEFESLDLFPEEGESDKIYVDTSTNKSYRWSGTLYILIALTDIVTKDTIGLMSPLMYKKLEKTASDLDIHDKQNLADFAEIRGALDKKVGKIVDSLGNVISNDVSIATIPDGTDLERGLLTPTVYKLVYENKKLSEYLDDNKVEEIRDFYGNPLPKVGTIVTIPNATTLTVGLMTPDDKEILNKIQPEFVKELGLVASTDVGDLMAARSEIAGNTNISFIRYRTTGVSAEKVTTIFLWRNGINETAQIKFVDKALWRRNVTGATGIAGATTSVTQWERTGAHYLGYDVGSRTLQLKDYNQTVFRTVLLPLALGGGTEGFMDGLLSGKDKMAIGSIITGASFDQSTGKAIFRNDRQEAVTSFTISTATENRDGLLTSSLVNSIHAGEAHIINLNNPHNVTKSLIGLSNVTNDALVKRSEMGVANGVATLNSEGKISSSYLPSYVSAVITADSYSTLPTTGEEDKIYVTKDTNLTYRWSGAAYVEISPSIALGETSTTAYAGNKGKALSDKVTDLSVRVGSGWLDTDTLGFAIIGTGTSKISIIPGATIHASIEGGAGNRFTISSNADSTYLGYGATLGLNVSVAVESVTRPDGLSKSALVLKDTTLDICLKVLCKDNNEFKLGTATNLTNTSNWVDLNRMEKISTMIEVDNGLVFHPSRLTGNSNDTDIILGTNTTIGSNVTIGSYSSIGDDVIIDSNAIVGARASVSSDVIVSTSIKDTGTGYILLGDGTTKIKKGVTIDGNSGSSEALVHEYTYEGDGSWMIGTDSTPNTTGVQLGKGIIILGTNLLNQPILIKAQNRNNATALIGANFNAYSGVTLGTNATFGDAVNLESDVVIKSHTYIGESVSIGNSVSLPNNFVVEDGVSLGTSVSVSDSGDEVSVGDVTLSTGISITKNASATTILNGNTSSTAGGKLLFGTGNIIWSGVEIGTGVNITEDLTSDTNNYKLGETSLTTISKGLGIYCSDVEHALKITAPTSDGGSLYSFGNVLLGTNFQVSPDVSLGISLGTGSIDAVSYYQLKDPKNLLKTSNIGVGVTIGSGIQIKESGSGGIQIYVPSLAKWITIS